MNIPISVTNAYLKSSNLETSKFTIISLSLEDGVWRDCGWIDYMNAHESDLNEFQLYIRDGIKKLLFERNNPGKEYPSEVTGTLKSWLPKVTIEETKKACLPEVHRVIDF